MNIRIKQEDNGRKGRFFTSGGAEVVYTYAGPKKIIIEHTGVPEALSGKDIGKNLVKACIDWAREEGIRVIPLCPFAKALIEKYPLWGDVVI